MASFTTVPIQFERDLRSAHKDYKRQKDASSKWAFGSRPISGCQVDWFTGEAYDGRGVKSTKCRPRHKCSNLHHTVDKDGSNIVKWNRSHMRPVAPPARLRVHANARAEMADAPQSSADLNHMMGSSTHSFHKARGPLSPDNSTAAGFLYSFDNTDSPPPVLTLDVFVKPNVRATEKMLEREYEILDTNGHAVKGRKARQMLRRAAAADKATAIPLDEVLEDEGFQLV